MCRGAPVRRGRSARLPNLFFLWLRADCRINNAIIGLQNNNTVPAQICLPTFGSLGGQATLPDDCVARVTS
jgi:hypothetical protein